MNTLMIWVFWLYIVPMIALILFMLFEGYNPFIKENAKIVFIPVINLYYFLLEYAIALLFFLISWGEFIEDIGKFFKKRFL